MHCLDSPITLIRSKLLGIFQEHFLTNFDPATYNLHYICPCYDCSRHPHTNISHTADHLIITINILKSLHPYNKRYPLCTVAIYVVTV